jgi:transposase
VVLIKKEKIVRKNIGRTSKYDPLIHVPLAKWLTRDGFTRDQIAARFEIHVGTFDRWVHDNPDLKLAIKKGKEEVRYEIEDSLIKRAMGYEYEKQEVEIFVKGTGKRKKDNPKPVKSRDGLKFGEDESPDDAYDEFDKAEYKKTKITVVHVPGDVTAQIFYLKTQWKDKYGESFLDLSRPLGEASHMAAQFDQAAELLKRARDIHVGSSTG